MGIWIFGDGKIIELNAGFSSKPCLMTLKGMFLFGCSFTKRIGTCAVSKIMCSSNISMDLGETNISGGVPSMVTRWTKLQVVTDWVGSSWSKASVQPGGPQQQLT